MTSANPETHLQNESLKVMSWNINGMRTLDMPQILRQLSCTVLAVQETKLARKQLDQTQMIPHGYSSYFSFSSNRVGYSGVATFCKDDWTPMKAEDGLCIENCGKDDVVGCYPEISIEEEPHVKHANADGRTVITQHLVMMPDNTHQKLTIINVYCPRLRDDLEEPLNNNTEFKTVFHEVLHRRAKQLVEAGSFVMLLGDINISHRPIDQCDSNENGFLVNDFRQLLNQFLDAKDPTAFVDTYRDLHPNQEAAYTCWCTRLNARQNNYGTRIDYIFVDKELSKYVAKAEIHPEVMGSDHCPISVTFHSLRPITHKTPPSFASKFFPEFKQKNIKDLLLQSSSQQSSSSWIPKADLKAGKELMEKNNKKRALECDTIVKAQPAKRVQTSLRSFFEKNDKPENKTSSEASKSPENEIIEQTRALFNFERKVNNNSDAWKKLMKAPEVPMCQGHNEPCVRRTVKKKGVNFGRDFWACCHGVGKTNDPNANCNFFQWVKPPASKS